MDSYFDNNNYETPQHFYKNSFSIPLSSSVYKRQFIYVKNIDYFTDYGLIFEDEQQVSVYQVDSATADLYFNSAAALTPNTLSEMSITIKNIKDVYSRKYYKLQNLAADLGGVLKAVLIVSVFFNKIISEPMLNNYIYDSLFGYTNLNKKINQKSKIQIKDETKRNLNILKSERIEVNSKNKFLSKNEIFKFSKSKINNVKLLFGFLDKKNYTFMF